LSVDLLSAACRRRGHGRGTSRKRLIAGLLAHVTPSLRRTNVHAANAEPNRHSAHSLRPGRFNPVSSHRTQPSHPHMLDRENLCDTRPAKRLRCHDETLLAIGAAVFGG